ncbi:methyltransferas-like protein type 11 [Plenodomus tracheiphilus IPT5]|uniref:Methyltransferas-like protein type 11 n=1 Tax=Plenodomus tracheiphilus IPT5 TaxID=1408161 RepID=A0A6A7B8D1_9PLEO|nr:methyltransferas-like protein type 11 [Plenodomus tracheiphilus IPT5]
MPSNADIARDRFSKEALEWDSNAKHVESTSKALQAIQRYIPAFIEGHDKDLDVLEIGCGTGLLSFMLSPHINTLIGVDTAPGMISAFDTKASALPTPPNLISLTHYLASPDSPALQTAASNLATARGLPPLTQPPRFDLAISHLTLHHIPVLKDLFTTLLGCLRQGGWVAFTDYEDFGDEAVAFHPVSKREGVERHGIRKKEAERLLREVGFQDVRVEEAFVLRKEVEAEGGRPVREMDFPFLICLGRKG